MSDLRMTSSKVGYDCWLTCVSLCVRHLLRRIGPSTWIWLRLDGDRLDHALERDRRPLRGQARRVDGIGDEDMEDGAGTTGTLHADQARLIKVNDART